MMTVKTGCRVGNLLVNHIIYGDDLVLFSPSGAGLEQLLHMLCYVVEHDIRCNACKRTVMICKPKRANTKDFQSLNHQIIQGQVCWISY